MIIGHCSKIDGVCASGRTHKVKKLPRGAKDSGLLGSIQGGTESVRAYKERPTVFAPFVGGTWGSVCVRIGGRFRTRGGSVLGLEPCKGLRERSDEEVRWKSLNIVKALGMKESSVAEHTFHEQETFGGVRLRLGLEPRVFGDRNHLTPSMTARG